jgi:hypothetical protein
MTITIAIVNALSTMIKAPKKIIFLDVNGIIVMKNAMHTIYQASLQLAVREVVILQCVG